MLLYQSFSTVSQILAHSGFNRVNFLHMADDKQVDVTAEKDLFSWKAPARPFKRRDREFWVRVIAISGIGGFILFLAEGAMPVILLIAIVFLFYILSTVEPEVVEYKITNKGIKIGGQITDWSFLTRFWFTKRWENELLILETFSLLGRLEIIISPKDKAEIQKVLSKYILYEEAPATNLDKITNWASKKFTPAK